jgi:hypothetical protein
MYVSVAMAPAAALVYLLMFLEVLHPGHLDSGSQMPAFFLVIPACYALGGLLILLKKRWLLTTGAVINTFTLAVFYTMYASQPDVMLSAPGLLTKIAQAILEIGLIFLVFNFKSLKLAP